MHFSLLKSAKLATGLIHITSYKSGTKVNRFLVVAPGLPQIKNLSQIKFSNGNPPPFCTLHTILSKK